MNAISLSTRGPVTETHHTDTHERHNLHTLMLVWILLLLVLLLNYYFCLMSIFPGEPGSASPSQVLLLHLCQKTTSRTSGMGFCTPDVHPVTQLPVSKCWRNSQHWPALILSSSTTGLLKKVPLCSLSDVSTKKLSTNLIHLYYIHSSSSCKMLKNISEEWFITNLCTQIRTAIKCIDYAASTMNCN